MQFGVPEEKYKNFIGLFLIQNFVLLDVQSQINNSISRQFYIFTVVCIKQVFVFLTS